ncbi:hypothetical protein K788_00020365 [Paraburkholderia caribensis MBA4]|uniref:Uncharacterized protein n=1 Tax=Paraburkholderia caribensis MBA4 TaxID=1323664 RepID=A0A0P0R4H6_9BURK|nr:hypothetical protein K788_00020365 [Paraburkholderia caribensis MBA4]
MQTHEHGSHAQLSSKATAVIGEKMTDMTA